MILAALYAMAGKLAALETPSTRAGFAAVVQRYVGNIEYGDVLRGEFAIIDIKTSGHGTAHAEILEIAALRIAPGFTQIGEFNVLIEPECVVPRSLAGHIGLPSAKPAHCGLALQEAMRQLANFVKRYPLFSNNASVDQSLLSKAAMRHGLSFDNPFYDSLLVAWSAWPGLPSHEFSALSEQLGQEHQPAQRALASVQTTLAVLRAASHSMGIP
jgi:DNA polymerase III alpha subunit (gram-positive type)